MNTDGPSRDVAGGALASRAYELAEAGELAAAERLLRAAIASGDESAHFNLGNVLRDLGRHEEAIEAYRSAVEGGEPDALLNLALALDDSDAREEAAVWYRRAADAGYPKALIGLSYLESMIPLANLLASGGENAAAERTYRQAIAHGDDHAHHNLGLLLRDLGRTAEAEEQLRLGAKLGDRKARRALRQ